MNEQRTRPLKLFEVLIAHGPYVKGHRFQPTGIYRDHLLRQGIIKEVKDEVVDPKSLRSPENRMLNLNGESLPLMNRGKRRQITDV